MGKMAAHGEPIAMLIPRLRQFAERPIVDKTGLNGRYDWMLEFEPRSFDAIHGEPDAAPMISVAIEQQLGLKFVEKKLPFDVVVVDHIEKNPVEN